MPISKDRFFLKSTPNDQNDSSSISHNNLTKELHTEIESLAKNGQKLVDGRISYFAIKKKEHAKYFGQSLENKIRTQEAAIQALSLEIVEVTNNYNGDGSKRFLRPRKKVSSLPPFF